MMKSRYQFFLHAQVIRAEPGDEAFNEALAGYPVARRLNRVERAVAAYYGKIEQRFDNGMRVVFNSADSAVLGACEMQYRCAALPQVLLQKFGLRIGIHCGLIQERQNDIANNAAEFSFRLSLCDDTILISPDILEALGKDLRPFARPYETPIADMNVSLLAWREIPSGIYGRESFRHVAQTSPWLRLYFGLKTLEVAENNPVVTIGRDPSSDVVLASNTHASRQHCRIERSAEGILISDASVNGTLVIGDGQQEVLIKNRSVALTGSGMLFFGRPFNGERRGGIHYEVL